MRRKPKKHPELALRILYMLETWPYDAVIYDDWQAFKASLEWKFRTRIEEEEE